MNLIKFFSILALIGLGSTLSSDVLDIFRSKFSVLPGRLIVGPGLLVASPDFTPQGPHPHVQTVHGRDAEEQGRIKQLKLICIIPVAMVIGTIKILNFLPTRIVRSRVS